MQTTPCQHESGHNELGSSVLKFWSSYYSTGALNYHVQLKGRL